MLILPGPPALSAFRLAKLAERLEAVDPAIRLTGARYVHFAHLQGSLADGQRAVLDSLLAYDGVAPDAAGDLAAAPGETLLLAVPRRAGARTRGARTSPMPIACDAGVRTAIDNSVYATRIKAIVLSPFWLLEQGLRRLNI